MKKILLWWTNNEEGEFYDRRWMEYIETDASIPVIKKP
jgi:hypothetical protein